MIPGKEVGSNEVSPQPIAVELIAVLVAVADGAVSDQTLAGPLRVVGLDHEQPVPIFQ